MAELKESPYLCHVLVCTNDRGGARRSCADGDSLALRVALKEAVAARGWRGRVRVSASGCMGLCDRGPNVMIYPQKLWFSAASPDDAEAIVTRIAAIVAGDQ